MKEMKKSTKRAWTLLVLCLCLIVLGGGYLFLRNFFAKDTQPQETETQTVFNVPSASVTALSYTNQEKDVSLSFHKENDEWIYDADAHMPLKQSQFTSMLSQITVLSSLTEVQNPLSLEEYGLDAPAYTYTVQYRENGTDQTRALLLGDANTFGGNEGRYMKFTDSDTIYLIKDTVSEYLDNDKDDWLDTEVLPGLNQSTMQSAELVRGEQTVRVTDSETLNTLYTLYQNLDENNYYSYYTDYAVLQAAGISDVSDLIKLTYTQQVAVNAEENATATTTQTIDKTFTIQLRLGGEVKDTAGGTVRAVQIIDASEDTLSFIYCMDQNTYQQMLSCFAAT